MPSRDDTGKRLSGAKQRHRKDDAPTPRPGEAYESIPVPPLTAGVVAVAEWASTKVLPCCVQVAMQGLDMDRVRLMQVAAGKLGRLRDKALRAEQAVKVREDRLRIAVDVLGSQPPDDPIGTLLWGYLTLAKTLWALIQTDEFKASQYTVIIDACASMGLLSPNAAIDALLEEISPVARQRRR